MAWHKIGASIDDVMAEVRRIQREEQHMPTPSQVRAVNGPSAGVTQVFDVALQRTMNEAATALNVMLSYLDEMNRAVAGALDDLAGTDDEARVAVANFENTVDGAASGPSTTSGGGSRGYGRDW